MKLNVLERLICQQLLPQETNFANLKLLRKARENLSFTEEQLEALDFKDGVNAEGKPTSRWNQEAMVEIGEQDIKLTVTPIKAIQKALKDLEEEDNKKTGEKGMLKPEHETLYQKFIIDDPLEELEESSKVIPIGEGVNDEEPVKQPEEPKEETPNKSA